MTQVTSKTTEHDFLLQRVDTALRAPEQIEVSRLDALVAELARNTAEGGHSQALTGLTNLQAEVRALTADTQGHLQDLKTNVGNLQAACSDFTNRLQGVEVALCQRVEQLAQAQHAQAQAPQAAPTAGAYAQAPAHALATQGGQGQEQQHHSGVPVFPPVRGRPTAFQPATPPGS